MTTETLALVTAGLREAVGHDCGLNKVVKFDFGGDGVVVINATTIPNKVDNEDAVAHCTISQSLDDFIALSEGRLNTMTAMMSGRLRIAGDMSLALRIDAALSRPR